MCHHAFFCFRRRRRPVKNAWEWHSRLDRNKLWSSMAMGNLSVLLHTYFFLVLTWAFAERRWRNGKYAMNQLFSRYSCQARRVLLPNWHRLSSKTHTRTHMRRNLCNASKSSLQNKVSEDPPFDCSPAVVGSFSGCSFSVNQRHTTLTFRSDDFDSECPRTEMWKWWSVWTSRGESR